MSRLAVRQTNLLRLGSRPSIVPRYRWLHVQSVAPEPRRQKTRPAAARPRSGSSPHCMLLLWKLGRARITCAGHKGIPPREVALTSLVRIPQIVEVNVRPSARDAMVREVAAANQRPGEQSRKSGSGGEGRGTGGGTVPCLADVVPSGKRWDIFWNSTICKRRHGGRGTDCNDGLTGITPLSTFKIDGGKIEGSYS